MLQQCLLFCISSRADGKGMLVVLVDTLVGFLKGRGHVKFIRYFNHFYMEGPFNGMWSHYKTEGPRTNNQIEAYNLALKKIIQYKSSPNRYGSVEMFQQQELKSRKKLLEFTIDPKPRLHRQQDPNVKSRNSSYKTLKRLLEREHLQPLAFLESLSAFYYHVSHSTPHVENLLEEPEVEAINFNEFL
jgi:hypothetical protein